MYPRPLDDGGTQQAPLLLTISGTFVKTPSPAPGPTPRQAFSATPPRHPHAHAGPSPLPQPTRPAARPLHPPRAAETSPPCPSTPTRTRTPSPSPRSPKPSSPPPPTHRPSPPRKPPSATHPNADWPWEKIAHVLRSYAHPSWCGLALASRAARAAPGRACRAPAIAASSFSRSSSKGRVASSPAMP
jgi:hypothetical protein